MNRARAQAEFERCRRIAEGREDITEDERRDFPQQVAREYARAEERRNPEPQPQLDLPAAA